MSTQSPSSVSRWYVVGGGGRGGFSTFLYLCNQRREISMVIFTDGLFPGPGAFVSPTALCRLPWESSGPQSQRTGVAVPGSPSSSTSTSLLCPHWETAGPTAPLPPTLQLHGSRCSLPAWSPSAPTPQPGSALPPRGTSLDLTPVCEPVRVQGSRAENPAAGTH